MGRMKENPKYNVISLRITDEDLARLEAVRFGNPRQKLLHAALMMYLQAREAKHAQA